MQTLPLKISPKLEIHGVGAKTCKERSETVKNGQKRTNVNFWGMFWGEEPTIFSQKFQK